MSDPIHHLPKRIDESSNRLHFYETHWKRVGLKLLADHAGSSNGLKLLDYGCGRGETLNLAHEAGMDPMGADLDPECVALSAAHGKAVLIDEPNDPSTQFGKDSFDVVTCFHVLEHVDRPKELLSALGRITRKYVVIAVPNLRALPKPRHLRSEPQFVNEGHLQGWDHPHLRNLAERHCGLKLVAWGYDHVRIPILGSLVSRLLGEKTLIRLETGIFLRLFRFHSASLIALFEKPAAPPSVER
ncbi:MAG: class I SAM-dependent methyltransferase [Luteolibacter sp.]